MGPEERIAALENYMKENRKLRKQYKAELASIERRQKKLRRKEKESEYLFLFIYHAVSKSVLLCQIQRRRKACPHPDMVKDFKTLLIRQMVPNTE